MLLREKIIKNYILGYNQFDIGKMVVDFDENIIFENIQDDKINMLLEGITAFKQQAEKAKEYFSNRTQIIKSFKHSENSTEIKIEYHATLAIDFPNGLKKGKELNLKGRSIFVFKDNKVTKLSDIS